MQLLIIVTNSYCWLSVYSARGSVTASLHVILTDLGGEALHFTDKEMEGERSLSHLSQVAHCSKGQSHDSSLGLASSQAWSPASVILE